MNRGSVKRSALVRRVRKLIDDVREALRLGDPGADDAIDQLEVGVRSLARERQVIEEDADRHREADDEG